MNQTVEFKKFHDVDTNVKVQQAIIELEQRVVELAIKLKRHKIIWGRISYEQRVKSILDS